jgi:glycosyltransferase involved in cell wall biosynthesis
VPEGVFIDVIVDGEDDLETANFLKTIKLKHPELCLDYFVIPRQGLSASRNFGADIARGDFIRFQDDDDSFSYQNLKKVLDFHSKEENDRFALLTNTVIHPSAFSPFMRFISGEGGQLFGYKSLRKMNSSFEYFWGGRASIRTEIARKIRFDENLKFGAEDIEFMFRVLEDQRMITVYDKDICGVMLRELTFAEMCSRGIRQGFSNGYVEKKHKGNGLAIWATHDLLTTDFTDMHDLKSHLKHLVKVSNRFTLLNVLEIDSIPTSKVFLEQIWSSGIQISRNIGFLLYRLGFENDSVENFIARLNQ